MRVVARRQGKITKEAFAELLGQPVKDIRYKDTYFQVILDNKQKGAINADEISVYMRCSDLRNGFNLDDNILDQNMKKEKDGSFTYYYEEEIAKCGFNKDKLRKILGRLV